MTNEIEIPNVDHTVYDKSFLDKIVVKINHSVKFDSSNNNAIVDLLKNKYSLLLSEQEKNLLEYKTLRLKDENNGLHIKISDSFVQIVLDGRSYFSFKDSLLAHIEGFLHCIFQMGGDINKFSIEKVNLWPIKILNTEGEKGLIDWVKKIFSNPLVENLNNHYVKDNLKAELTLNSKSDSCIDILSYGWLRNGYKVLFILNNEGICSDTNMLSQDQIFETITLINQRLFDIFHWGVSDLIINIMSNKK